MNIIAARQLITCGGFGIAICNRSKVQYIYQKYKSQHNNSQTIEGFLLFPSIHIFLSSTIAIIWYIGIRICYINRVQQLSVKCRIGNNGKDYHQDIKQR